MHLKVITDNLPLLASGWAITIQVAAFGIVVGTFIAVVTAAARLSNIAPLRWVFAAYVEIIRNTPLLVQILLLFLGPSELGFRLDGVQTLALCLAVNNGAYMSEIVRGGLQAVPRGQLEAAAAIGLRPSRTFFEIILPQALHTIYPAMSNQFISVILSSSLGAVIGSGELTTVVLEVNSQTYRTIELLAFLTIAYAIMSYIVAVSTRLFGRRLDRAY